MKNGQKIEKKAKPRQTMVILDLLKMRKRNTVTLIKTETRIGKRTVDRMIINDIIGNIEPMGIRRILIKYVTHIFIHLQATFKTTMKAIT